MAAHLRVCACVQARRSFDGLETLTGGLGLPRALAGANVRASWNPASSASPSDTSNLHKSVMSQQRCAHSRSTRAQHMP